MIPCIIGRIMTRFKKIIIIVSCLLLVLLVGGYVYFRLIFPYKWTSPTMLAVESPARAGKALFITEGFVDRGVALYIVEEAVTSGAREIDSLDFDGRRWFHDAVWSSDGSVIGIRCRVLNSSDLVFTHTYDFREKKSIVPSTLGGSDTKEYWDTHSAKIEELISSRGGEGVRVVGIREKSQKMSFWEWKRFAN